MVLVFGFISFPLNTGQRPLNIRNNELFPQPLGPEINRCIPGSIWWEKRSTVKLDCVVTGNHKLVYPMGTLDKNRGGGGGAGDYDSGKGGGGDGGGKKVFCFDFFLCFMTRGPLSWIQVY